MEKSLKGKVALVAGGSDRQRWSGQSLSSGQLAKVYGFTDRLSLTPSTMLSGDAVGMILFSLRPARAKS